MAYLYITEYIKLAKDSHMVVQAGQEPAIATQRVSFTTATQSAAFNAKTNFVRLSSDLECHVLFGNNPTADATTTQMQADTPEFFGVNGGDKISVYDGTS